jgi:hypothetical protein
VGIVWWFYPSLPGEAQARLLVWQRWALRDEEAEAGISYQPRLLVGYAATGSRKRRVGPATQNGVSSAAPNSASRMASRMSSSVVDL